MTQNRLASFCIAAVLAGSGAPADAEDMTGRGVFPFASTSGCPLEKLTGQATDCNHLALDDADTRASLDNTAHAIRFENTRSYPKKTIVGDVLLQGSGVDAKGVRVPLSFHIVLAKKGQVWSANRHVHAPVKGEFSGVRIDPFQVDAGPLGAARTMLTPAQVVEIVMHPSLATRLVDQLVQVADNRASGERDADITIGVGASRFSKSVMRARLHTDPVARTDLDKLLTRGTWAFELEALTGQIPDGVAERELFLYGLDQLPLLKPVAMHGFRKHDRLIVGAVDGKGYVRLGDKQEDFANADKAARAFLQQSFIGLVLGWQQLADAPHAR